MRKCVGVGKELVSEVWGESKKKEEKKKKKKVKREDVHRLAIDSGRYNKQYAGCGFIFDDG